MKRAMLLRFWWVRFALVAVACGLALAQSTGPVVGDGNLLGDRYVFRDPSSGATLMITLADSGAAVGRFSFTQAGLGMASPATTATVTRRTDGRFDVSYGGPGWLDPQALIDPMFGLQQSTQLGDAVSLQLTGTLDTQLMTGTVSLAVDGAPHTLTDPGQLSGAESVVAAAANATANEDWAALWNLMSVSVRASSTYGEFEAGIAGGFAAVGVIGNVQAGPVTYSDMRTGLDVATSTVTAEVADGEGNAAVVTATIGLIWETDRWVVLGVQIPPDVAAPSSQAGPIPSETLSPSLGIPYSAIDPGIGVDEIELWWRYRESVAESWSSWRPGPVGSSSPINFTFDGVEGSPAVGDYEFYTIAVDRAGNREAAPATADTGTSYGSGATWTPGIRVNDDTGSTQQDRPSVALGPDSAAYLIWDDYRPGTQADIYFSRRDPATGVWSANQRVNNDTSNRTQYQADIAVDGSNNAYAVWQDPRNGNKTPDPDIYFAKRSGATGAWSANVRVNGDTQGAPAQFAPAISVKSDGAAAAVWVDRRSNQWNIYSARLAAGGSTWAANLRVTSNTTSRKDGPDVVVGPEGTAYAVWEDDRNGNYDIWYSKLPAGTSTWSTNVKISDDSGTAAQYGARIGIDGAGNLMVTWLDDRPYPRTEVRMSRLSNGSSTWAPSMVVSDAPAYAGMAALAVKANGNAFVIWDDARGSSWDIWGSYFDATTGTWGNPGLISDDPGSQAQRSPTAAMDDSQIVAAWRDHRGDLVQGDIFARQRTPG